MLVIRVKVKLHAKASSLEGPDAEGLWLARLKSPPVDGRANEELIGLAATRFACPKSSIAIKQGLASRWKLLEIQRDD
jgi:uncharacterized protein YggU (UPF0235/DUF167 family)